MLWSGHVLLKLPPRYTGHVVSHRVVQWFIQAYQYTNPLPLVLINICHIIYRPPSDTSQYVTPLIRRVLAQGHAFAYGERSVAPLE